MSFLLSCPWESQGEHRRYYFASCWEESEVYHSASICSSFDRKHYFKLL